MSSLGYFLRNLDDDSSDSSSKCEMFGSFSVLIQLLLGLFSFSILIIKRFIEKPRRPWKVWFFDASKQIISACVVHLMNLCLSAIFANKESSDECVWYFLSVFMDCTLGVFLSYIFMWIVDGISKASNWKILETGLYFEKYMKNNKIRYKLKPKMYFAQLGIWLIVTIITKILIVIIIQICKRFLQNIGNFILSPFSNGKVKLVFVMVVFPVILNAINFWIVDSILKFSPEDSDKEINQLYEKENQKNPNVNTNEDNIDNQNNEQLPEEKKEIEALTNNGDGIHDNYCNGNKDMIGYSIELPHLEEKII